MQFVRLIRSSVFALVAALPLVACNSTQPAGTQMKDSAITAKIKTKLAADPEINPFNISVETNEGTVYLMGRVRNEYQKDEAEELARKTDGVTKVVNHIEVGDLENKSKDTNSNDMSSKH